MQSTSRHRLGLILVAAVVSTSGAAAAQAIYRCAPDLYSQQPCAGGHQLALTDSRSPQDVAEARAASAGQMKLAERMQRDRLAAERTRPLSSAAGIGPLVPSEKPAAHKSKRTGKAASGKASSKRPSEAASRPYKPGGFTAFAPGPAKPGRQVPKPDKTQD